MNIFTPDFEPPKTLDSDLFVIFQTDEKFYESDFAAVIKSRDILRIWSQSNWPEDDFTAEQNREDLRHHVEDNVSHQAYGYMIYSPDRKTCYGSLYINPAEPIAVNYKTTEEQRQQLKGYSARIDCWIAADIDENLETEILKSIRDWLTTVWKVPVIYSSRPGMDRRERIYEKFGLKLFAELQSANSDMRLRVFH